MGVAPFDSSTDAADPVKPGADTLNWLSPNYRATPAEALPRIKVICQLHSDLHAAMWTVMATHPSLPPDILAAAIQQCRPDTQALTREDLRGLMTALVNGGRQGFDAVLRTRRQLQRTASSGASALPWAQG